MSRKLTTIEFIEKAIEIHRDTYDYSLVEYVGAKTKVQIICSIHGVFKQIPDDHLREHGCKQCGSSRSDLYKLEKASSEFVHKASVVHDNRYNYLLVDYTGRGNKVQITCPRHGVFWQTPKDHLRGKGCPACAITGFDKTKSAVLYYLKVTLGNIIAYKIGITNRSVQERFNNTDLDKIQVLKIWEFLLGVNAYREEQDILNEYRDFKYQGAPILKNGNTELFTKDILGLSISLGGELLD